jgi:TrwC relaxase
MLSGNSNTATLTMKHRRVQGEWHGRGAELLGLHEDVAQKKFEAVREGLHPETEAWGKRLCRDARIKFGVVVEVMFNHGIALAGGLHEPRDIEDLDLSARVFDQPFIF